MLQRWAPSNGKHCVPFVFSLMSFKWAKIHPTNPSNVYYSQARRQDFAVGGDEKSQGETFFRYNIECMRQPQRKKSLAICKLCSHLPRPRKLYRYERRIGRAPSFALATWTREETRNSIFCKSLKFLSACRLFSRFSFAPSSSFMPHKLQHTRRFAIQQK